MSYLIHLSNTALPNIVVLKLDDTDVQRPAIDVVFDIIGVEEPEQLVLTGRLQAEQINGLKSLQELIFGSDAEGRFIREGVSFLANGKELDPDAPMQSAFVAHEDTNGKDFRCRLTVETINQPPSNGAGDEKGKIVELQRMLFLHQIAVGGTVDVTKEYPDLPDVISFAEKKTWIEIDVQKAAYKLTQEGQQVHETLMTEAEDLIRRYDIFADVDVDMTGNARFDTGLGKDLRVAVWELDGIDPFRARFLLGLNDGEWNNLPDWQDKMQDEGWWDGIMDVVERAADAAMVGGENRLRAIIDQGKAALRREQQPQY